MVERLGADLHVRIVTRDRDLGDTKPYPEIRSNAWQRVGTAEVLYLPPAQITLKGLLKILQSTPYEIIYLNSFFSRAFTLRPLLLRRIGLLRDVPLVLAPRGELLPGALTVKRFRKYVFAFLAKRLGLYGNVHWQASAEHEGKYIKTWFGRDVHLATVPDLPRGIDEASNHARPFEKPLGSLRVAFLGRLAPNKNLDGALRMLQGVKARLEFNIYGLREDPAYWRRCRDLIERLPPTIKVRYHGVIGHQDVLSTLTQNHILFLPTKGENFGHAILEALISGCPVLVSDQTPWRDLETKGIGWDIPLNQPELFQERLERCAAMNADELGAWSQRARDYGLRYANDDEEVVEGYHRLFRNLVNGRD